MIFQKHTTTMSFDYLDQAALRWKGAPGSQQNRAGYADLHTTSETCKEQNKMPEISGFKERPGRVPQLMLALAALTNDAVVTASGLHYDRWLSQGILNKPQA